jgi:hypothetical protein
VNLTAAAPCLYYECRVFFYLPPVFRQENTRQAPSAWICNINRNIVVMGNIRDDFAYAFAFYIIYNFSRAAPYLRNFYSFIKRIQKHDLKQPQNNQQQGAKTKQKGKDLPL